MSSKSTLYRTQQNQHKAAFASELCRLMAEKGLNQPGLAKNSGIPRDQISRYCNGHSLPGAKNQDRLAKALGVSRTDLLKGWVIKRHSDDYLSVRQASRNRVAIELKKTVSPSQASKIMDILGSDSAPAIGG